MKQYTAGELGKLAGVSARTIRYYDQRDLLTPSGRSEGGYRLYDETALLRLQQIIMLKFAGFSLEEIRNVLLLGQGQELRDVLEDQKQLLVQRIGQMQEIVMLLEDVAAEGTEDIERLSESMQLVRRINHSGRTYRFHETHGQRNLYPWEFGQLGLKPGEKVLDLGAGYGMIWRHAWESIPEHTEITLLDVHPKCIAETKRFYQQQKENLQPGVCFQWRQEDAETAALSGPYDHVLMAYLWKYLKAPEAMLRKVDGLLAPGGTLTMVQGGAFTLLDLDEIYHAFSGEYCLAQRREKEAIRLQKIEDALKAQFHSVETLTFESALTFTRTLDLYQYMMDSYQELVQEIEKQGGKFVSFLRRYVEEQGSVTIRSRVRLYRCKRG